MRLVAVQAASPGVESRPGRPSAPRVMLDGVLERLALPIRPARAQAVHLDRVFPARPPAQSSRGAVLRLLAVLALPACSQPDPAYACGPVGAYLFCAPDEACVGRISFSGSELSVWACAPDVGCDAPADDYCDASATSVACERTRAEVNDGSRPEVSVVRCTVP